jgi:type I restriction enzyme S subunit
MSEPLAVREAPASYVLNELRIRPGYKQTEVGVIPEDWDVRLLKDIISIKSGFAFSSKYYSDKGPILLTPGNFKLEGGLYFNERNTKRYSASYSSSMSFNYGDLLIVMTDLTPDCDLLGKPAFVQLHEPILHNQRIGKIIPYSSKFSLAFLYWYFLSDAHALRMKETATGSTVRHTSNGSIYGSLIPLPSTKAEQEAIAEALSDADALIEALEQLITKKRHLKQGAMQELLTGKKRLPGFGGEWETSTFGDVFNITAGGDVDPKRTISYQDQAHCYPIYSNALTEFGLYGYCSYADHQASSITVTARGTLGFANYRDHAYTAIGRVLVLQSKQKSDGRFFAEVINTRIKFSIESTGVPQLTAPQISTYRLPVPSLPEQTAIATLLSDMDTEIAALEQQLAKARGIKQGMMQELLTGKIRLV